MPASGFRPRVCECVCMYSVWVSADEGVRVCVCVCDLSVNSQILHTISLCDVRDMCVFVANVYHFML